MDDRSLDTREDGTGLEIPQEEVGLCERCCWYVRLEPPVDIDEIMEPLKKCCPPGLFESVKEKVKDAAVAHVCFYDGHNRYRDANGPCCTFQEI